MTYIGVDLGDKRVGIAIEVKGIAFPLMIIKRYALIPELQKIIKERSVTGIVVGLPYDLYGKEMTQLEKTKKVIEKLKQVFGGIEIKEIDERFTTFEAETVQTLLGKKSKPKDDIAAACILESFLQSNK